MVRVFFGVILMMVPVTVADTMELFVAPDGKADNPGTWKKPFSSLVQARDTVRQQRKTGKTDTPITVFVRGGEYFLDEPLVLTEEDSGTKTSPVTYRAYEGEKPVLAGGVPVSGWTQHDENIFKADLSLTLLKGKVFRMLIFDGKRQQLARYPNHNPDDFNGGSWAYVDGKRFDMYADSPDEGDYLKNHQHLDFWQRNIPRLTRTLKVKEQDVHPWSNLQQAEISIFPRFNWWHYVLKVESFDPNERMLHLAPGSFYEIRPGDRYFIRGLREELDSPGEWYYDTTESILYFWPPESIGNKPVFASTLENMIKMDDCSNVTVQGFTIECCEKTAVQLKDCTDCVIARNTIRNVGDTLLADPHADNSYFEGSAVSVQGGKNNGIIGNDIYDIGSYGILLSGGDVEKLQPANNYAENNVIHHVGVVDRKAKGIEMTGCGQRIRHNLICHIPQSGIYAWGNKHLIEYNRMQHTCLEGEDTGAIGGGAIDWLSWQGMIIRYNIIADTMGYGYNSQTGQWESPHFVWALYPDWAASGVQIIGNIIIRAPLGLIHMHSGRENLIENNILIDGVENQVYLSGWTVNTGFWSTMVDGWIKKYETAIKYPTWQEIPTLKDPRKVPLPDGRVMLDNVFRRNILYYHDPSANLFRCPKLPLERHESDYNLIYHFGHPLRTGQFVLKSETGANLIDDDTFEVTPLGQLPSGWGGVYLPDFKASVESGHSHSGSKALRIIAPERQKDQTAPNILYMIFGRIPFEPSSTYRLSTWMKAETNGTTVELGVYSWKAGLHEWAVDNAIKLTSEWKQHELVFSVPDPDDPLYKPTMDELGCRIIVAAGTGTIWVDDISFRKAKLTDDEWEGWKINGMDKHSVVADPLFVAPEKDDYRLKSESPAFGLGFKQIPVEKIGPYKDELRASWPILEPVGAREAMK